MNRFTLEWLPEAENDLARIWMNSSDPMSVNRAQIEIDRCLVNDPTYFGQDMSEGLWRIVIPPIAVCYTVDAVARHVKVSNVFPTVR
jgi:hypothetical protein